MGIRDQGMMRPTATAVVVVAIAFAVVFVDSLPLSSVPEHGALGEQSAPNTAPKQVHLKKPLVKEHMPGKPMRAVGYPNQRYDKESEGILQRPLHDHIPPAPLKAEDRVYPNQEAFQHDGKMTAADIRELMVELDPYMEAGAKAKKSDGEWQASKNQMDMENMKRLTESIKGGVSGGDLLSGAIPQMLGTAKGNLGNCMKKLLSCKFYKKKRGDKTSLLELGESQAPADQQNTVYPKYTATEDYNREHGIHDDAEDIKNKPKTEYETKTATDEYIDGQTGGFYDLLPGMPGHKYSYDKMSSERVRELVQSVAKNIAEAKKMNALDMAMDMKAQNDAAERAMDALKDVTKSAMLMARARAMPKTAAVLKELHETNDKLGQCTMKVRKNCIDGISFRLADAAATETEVGKASTFSHPEDDPERPHSDPDDGPPQKKQAPNAEDGVTRNEHEHEPKELPPK